MDCPGCKNPDATGKFCNECGGPLAEPDPAEIFHYGQCPRCKEYGVKVMRTIRPWRELKCKVCEYHFQSIEVIWTGNKSLKNADQHKVFL